MSWEGRPSTSTLGAQNEFDARMKVVWLAGPQNVTPTSPLPMSGEPGIWYVVGHALGSGPPSDAALHRHLAAGGGAVQQSEQQRQMVRRHILIPEGCAPVLRRVVAFVIGFTACMLYYVRGT